MGTRTFSGKDVINVLVNVGPFHLDRVNGDHYILKMVPPESHHNTDPRTVTVPLHDELAEGTLKSIGEQAGMKDFDEFKDWIARNS